jgi:hypothetical protein
MSFLERFFSPENLHSVILVGCLIYLIKSERRMARLEAIIEIFFKHAGNGEETE